MSAGSSSLTADMTALTVVSPAIAAPGSSHQSLERRLLALLIVRDHVFNRFKTESHVLDYKETENVGAF